MLQVQTFGESGGFAVLRALWPSLLPRFSL
jgi:hypothetical protein